MIHFPNCKINLGLRVLRKREDGYHDIETVMVPVPGLCDALEILPDDGDGCIFSASGLSVDVPVDKNLCVRAYNLIRSRYSVGGVRMHLHKHIPFGAGLGGGSSDAVSVLKILNGIMRLNLPEAELEALAGELGSDTVFFVHNRPMLASGRGEILTPVDLDLGRYRILIVKPPFEVSTAEAYRGVVPSLADVPLPDILSGDIRSWRKALRNDFEESVSRLYPETADIKQTLYGAGAVYASLSGSGSAVFGLFEGEPEVPRFADNYFIYSGGML